MRLAVGIVITLMLLGGQPVGADAPVIWIVSGPGAGQAPLLDSLLDAGISAHAYPHLDMAAVLAPPSVARMLAADGWQIHPNEQYALHLDESVPAIEADRVKEAVGNARDGPTVLVIDTGIDSGHPDFEEGENLAANVAAARSPNGLISGFNDDRPVRDASGHGSHVAGIVSGSAEAFGPTDPRNGRFEGVYSNGRVASFQASNNPGPGQDIAVDLQAALEGYEWALANREAYDIRAITNSWGSPGDIDLDHPASQATLAAYAAGITVFFSAGNAGEEGTLNRHCMTPWVLCVAAGTVGDKTRAGFSSMGHPQASSLGPYDHPDLTAPGTGIRSAQPLTTDPLDMLSESSEALYMDRSGTSMAAPHAAGVAALIMAANDGLSPDQVMDILVNTVDPMADPVYKVGAGYINAREAYNLAVRTIGERQAFLDGQGVKYGGEATGDDELADDPISIGYDAQSGGSLDAAILAGPAAKPWFLTSPIAWVLSALGVVLVAIGIRLRR